MAAKVYNKLVRDKIPEIIEADGRSCKTEILSKEEQMIVGLSVFGGYNSTEIGKILSLKPGTVRVKRSRALEKMQCVLDGRTFYE